MNYLLLFKDEALWKSLLIIEIAGFLMHNFFTT